MFDRIEEEVLVFLYENHERQWCMIRDDLFAKEKQEVHPPNKNVFKTKLGKRLNRLRADGYINRRLLDRKVFYSLTPKGKRAAQPIAQARKLLGDPKMSGILIRELQKHSMTLGLVASPLECLTLRADNDKGLPASKHLEERIRLGMMRILADAIMEKDKMLKEELFDKDKDKEFSIRFKFVGKNIQRFQEEERIRLAHVTPFLKKPKRRDPGNHSRGNELRKL